MMICIPRLKSDVDEVKGPTGSLWFRKWTWSGSCNRFYCSMVCFTVVKVSGCVGISCTAITVGQKVMENFCAWEGITTPLLRPLDWNSTSNRCTCSCRVACKAKAWEWKQIQSILIPILLWLQVLIPIQTWFSKTEIYPFKFHLYPYVWKNPNSYSNSFKLLKNLPLELKERKLLVQLDENICQSESLLFPPMFTLLSSRLLLKLPSYPVVFQKTREIFN